MDNLTNRNTDEATNWQLIGYLKRIIIYLIDGGRGYEVQHKAALCTRNGLQAYVNGIRLDDRIFTVYKPSPESVITFHSNLEKLNYKKIYKEMKKEILKNGLNWNQETVNYLGDQIKLYDLGDDVVVKSKLPSYQLFGAYYLKVGVFLPPDRKTFVEKTRHTHQNKANVVVDGFSQNYSSYTLINTQSLKSFNQIMDKKVSHKYFKPQLVIKAEPYIEDDIKALKIGTVEFGNVIPCTHSPLSLEQDVYNVLKRIRPLNGLRPNLSNSNLPAFGINFEVLNGTDGVIQLNSPVYAKF